MRAYSKHQASFIFRLKELDLASLALEFGLLRLPLMPERKDRVVNFGDYEMNVSWTLSSAMTNTVVG